MKFRIRKVGTPRNPPTGYNRNIILSLDLKCFGKEESMEQDIPGIYWWLAYQNNIPIAYAGLQIIPINKITVLYRSGIKTRFRGRGLQKRLIRVRETAARRLGYETMLTYTHLSNFASNNSLISLNYKLYDPQWPWVGNEFIYWRKQL